VRERDSVAAGGAKEKDVLQVCARESERKRE
jgi:hypothetical protein